MKIPKNLFLLGSVGFGGLILVFLFAWLNFTKSEKEKVIGTYVNLSAEEAPIHHLKGSFVDSRDRQRYATINLFGQIWMAQNLNYDASDASSWCYNDDPQKCKRYGRLYTWKGAQTACPNGWRLPASRDWNEVYIRIGHVENCYDALISGGYMGFDALFGGWRTQDLSYKHEEERAYFWSNTLVSNAYARYYRLDTEKKKLSSDNAYKELAFSCRCVKE